MSQAKKATMVIDDALIRGRDDYWLSRLQWERIINARRRAESFVFTKAASRLIGRFAHECSDLILQHRQFAIPPFTDCYIEYDVDSYLDGFPETFRNSDLGAFPERMRDSLMVDGRIGYLINGPRLFVFVEGGEDGECFLMPIYYTMAPPGNQAPYDHNDYGSVIFLDKGTTTPKDVRDAEWNKLVCTIGTAIHKIHNEAERQSLLVESQIHLMGAHQWETDDLTRIMQCSAGEIRNLWSLLLWLNRPAHTTMTNVPPSRRFLSGKQVVYKKHRMVEIDLHKYKSLRRAFTLSGPRLSPRRHYVRGAFHHLGGERNCSHEWPLKPDEHGHWICANCRRHRFWVKEHVRGDATKGWVSHEYAVHT